MCCLIKKIKSLFCKKKSCCGKCEDPILKKAALSKEEVDNIIINSLKKVKKQKKIKTKPKTKVKPKTKSKNTKR